jgi:transcriptional regulator with XRE-family HTH domain
MTTLSEVARLAGVTSATVSNVLRQRGKVGEQTRQRVLEAVAQLGYRPHLTARALAEGVRRRWRWWSPASPTRSIRSSPWRPSVRRASGAAS